MRQYTSKQKEQGCGKIYHWLNSWLKVLKQTLWDNFHDIWFKYIRIKLQFVFACVDKQFKERLWLYSIVANSSDRTFPNENWTGKQLSPLCLNQDWEKYCFLTQSEIYRVLLVLLLYLLAHILVQRKGAIS